ncbi:MAG TPA: carbohydrate-binding protein [Firmicutes bacterium]|mgnify:CR=1 FL=1|jgi:hypothetical protein|nr:carbohydrate-binding protein [Bacillota bacterium]HOQ24537.1 carbohydrate-binding protein [Bacillota bacterium]HPT67323.1 carbohydrate-binding protein [Bacillota bacterium]
MASKKTTYTEVVEGIFMDPVPVLQGQEVKIKYKGYLTTTGAKKIFLHAGFGEGNWENVQDIPMRKLRDGGWSASLVAEGSRLNICFKDDAENWDNNFGQNWSFAIQKK